MGRRAGDSSRARWVGAVLLTGALVATACGGGGDDDSGPPAEAPEAPGAAEATMATTTTAPGEQTEPGAPPLTAPPTSLPEGRVVIPLDPELVDVLPRLNAGTREIVTDQSFDERLCTGDKAPALPKGQARATYEVSDSERITIAAYRFAPADGPLYLADYAAAVQACAVALGEIEGLGLPDAIGQAFRLTTTRGDAFIAMALRKEVIWVLFQENSTGEAHVTPATLDAFLRLLEG